MHERYLFRGKRVDNKQWVYGDYRHIKNNNTFWIINDENFVNSMYEVIPETICQCTGLRDKNEKLIFEGDIATNKTKAFDGYGKNLNLVIKWDERELYYNVFQDDGESLFYYKKLTQNIAKHLEIINNVF